MTVTISDQVIIAPDAQDPTGSVLRLVDHGCEVLSTQVRDSFPQDGRKYKVVLSFTIEPYEV